MDHVLPVVRIRTCPTKTPTSILAPIPLKHSLPIPTIILQPLHTPKSRTNNKRKHSELDSIDLHSITLTNHHQPLTTTQLHKNHQKQHKNKSVLLSVSPRKRMKTSKINNYNNRLFLFKDKKEKYRKIVLNEKQMRKQKQSRNKSKKHKKNASTKSPQTKTAIKHKKQPPQKSFSVSSISSSSIDFTANVSNVTTNMVVNNRDMKLYCICRTPYDPQTSSVMVQCNLCNNWFHPKCMGISERTAISLPVFACNYCETHYFDIINKQKMNEDKHHIFTFDDFQFNQTFDEQLPISYCTHAYPEYLYHMISDVDDDDGIYGDFIDAEIEECVDMCDLERYLNEKRNKVLYIVFCHRNTFLFSIL